MDATGSPDAARLDALRRRLYEPDATEEDIEAYRTAAEQGPEPVQEVAVAVPVVVPVPRRRRAGRAAAAAGALAVLVVVAVVVLMQVRALAPVAEPTPSPTASATEGRLPASAADRAAFVLALDSGEAPGLLDYVATHQASPPPALRPTGRSSSHEYSGQATQTISLIPPAIARRGGRVTVVVLLDGAGSFSWRAERIDQADDRSGPVVPVASHAGVARAGEPTFATVSYTGGVPTGLEVLVAESVRWAVVVTFTD